MRGYNLIDKTKGYEKKMGEFFKNLGISLAITVGAQLFIALLALFDERICRWCGQAKQFVVALYLRRGGRNTRL